MRGIRITKPHAAMVGLLVVVFLVASACGGGGGAGGGRSGNVALDLEAFGVAIGADGKIVVAGRQDYGADHSTDFALARFTPDGRLDRDFGANGKVVTDVGSGEYLGYDFARAVRVQSDGKIVAAGPSVLPIDSGQQPVFVPRRVPPKECFALVRYTAAGEVDASFGGDGIVRTPFSLDELYSYGEGAAFMPGGRLVLAGVGARIPNSREGASTLALARYLPNGHLDASLGSNGTVEAHFDSGFSAIAVQGDGKIVVAGGDVSRYLQNGRLDRRFGRGGTAAIPFGADGDAGAVVIQRDGKIVIAGSRWPSHANMQFALARYTRDGRLDRTFGNGGLVSLRFGALAGAGALALQDDGKIIVGGGKEMKHGESFVLARYAVDGRLDPTFGNKGTVSMRVGDSWVKTVAIQADGKIIAIGADALARFNIDGRLDRTFGADAER
jgi:uncharacterized delta-60 repeat protein